MASGFEAGLNKTLEIVMPLAMICVIIWIFWKPFKFGELFSFLGNKIKEWRDNREDNPKESPIDRLSNSGKTLVFE
jgi:hypothetical protein